MQDRRIILGIDPGGGSPGYCVECAGEVFAFPTWAALLAAGWSPLDFSVAVTEGTWHRPAPARGKKAKGATPANVAKLSFTCGLQLMRVMAQNPAVLAYRLPVDLWKGTAVYGGARLPKDVFVSRLMTKCGLPEDWTEDQVEARGLILAWSKLDPAVLKKHRIREPK